MELEFVNYASSYIVSLDALQVAAHLAAIGAFVLAAFQFWVMTRWK